MQTALQLCACLFLLALSVLALGVGLYWLAQTWSVWTTKGMPGYRGDEDGGGDYLDDERRRYGSK